MLNRLQVAFILAAFTMISCGTGTPPLARGSKVFVGARIIDGTGATPIDNGVILVSEGRIVAAGSAADVQIPKEAERIDVRGKFIMPAFAISSNSRCSKYP